MPTPILTADIDHALRPAPINPDWIIDGSPQARNAELFRSRDGLSCTVLWDCTPGRFEWVYDKDETIHLLEGAVELDDGVHPPRQMGPGSIVFFPAGSRVRWTVTSKVRKVAFFRRALPGPVAKAFGLMLRVRRAMRPGPMNAIASI